MPRDSITIAAPPDRVFEVLSDPDAYGEWVVGAGVLGGDARWPKPGTSLRYEMSLGPLRVRDRTLVVEADPPRRLELRALLRPLPPAAITIELEPQGPRATRVTLDERPANRLAEVALGPVGWAATSLRNRWSLRRLARLVEARPSR
jgi:uncharacterized protein YndB with AHSA1/START domain